MLAWLQAFVSCCGLTVCKLGSWGIGQCWINDMALVWKALPPLCWHLWPGYMSKRKINRTE